LPDTARRDSPTSVEASVACLPESAGIAQPNPPSVALHRRFGFTPVGMFTDVSRKFGRYRDVTWLERPLNL
jgi:L-amino acid N-acyltransferase YncA